MNGPSANYSGNTDFIRPSFSLQNYIYKAIILIFNSYFEIFLSVIMIVHLNFFIKLPRFFKLHVFGIYKI